MSDFRFVASIIFVILFMISGAFIASTDQNVPMTQLELPVEPSDFDYSSIMRDVPKIPQIQLRPPPSANTTLVTAGIPVIEQIEGFFRDVAYAVDSGLRYAAMGLIFAMNTIISVFWLLGNLIVLFYEIIRIDQWPIMQSSPLLQQFSLMLTAALGIAVVVFFIYLFAKLIPTMGG